MLKLNPKFKGANVFVRELGRKIEVTEKNMLLLIQNNVQHVFVFDEPKKDIEPTTPKPTKKTRKPKAKDNDK